MKSPDPLFILEPEEYTRNLNVLNTAIDAMALYLSIKFNKPIEECKKFVLANTNEKSKTIKVLARQENGDRARKTISAKNLIEYTEKTKSILTPNMVIYDDTIKNLSLSSEYIDGRKKKRGAIKKMGMIAKQNKDQDLAASCSNEEYRIKVRINSSSGARNSPHNVLYNKTAHSSLTSNTRVMTSYSNANSERFLSGNRHYHSYEVTLENLINIIRCFDFPNLEKVIHKYNLYFPKPIDVMSMIKRSTRFYWQSKKQESQLMGFLERLTPLQLAALLYNGDMYHLIKYNDNMAREFVKDFINIPVTEEIIDTQKALSSCPEALLSFICLLCSDFLAGTTIENIKATNPQQYNRLGQVAAHIQQKLLKYQDLIKCLWVNKCPPGSIFYLPYSIRRSVVGSDTDSTMFTVQDAIKWYFGGLVFNKTATNVSNLFVFLNTSVIGHWIAMMSKQIGVADHNLYELKMKSEFTFPIYLLTNLAKHYYAPISSREGNVFLELLHEIKGVGLKDSTVPKFVMKGIEDEFKNITTIILAGKKIKAHALMQRIANLEHEIKQSLENGEIKYLTTLNISPRESYKKPMSSGYMHYDIWETALGFYYGHSEKPPYRSIKISTTLKNKTSLLNWANSFPPEIRDKLLEWMTTNNKSKLQVLRLPYELFAEGLPKDIVSIMAKRDIYAKMLNGYYIMMEALGFYIRDKKSSLLISDDIAYRPEFGIPRLLTEEEL